MPRVETTCSSCGVEWKPIAGKFYHEPGCSRARADVRESDRLKRVHSDENFRSGLVTAGLPMNPYHDPDGRDIVAPEED